MIHKITVPSTENIIVWADFIQKNRCITVLTHYPEKSVYAVEFNFDATNVIRPHHVVTLACLIEEYHQFDVKILFQDICGNRVCDYLRNINLWSLIMHL